MEKVVKIVVVVLLSIGIWFAVMGGLWWLWRWVLPQVYASGPATLLAPGFWLFAAAWTLLALIGRNIFGSSK